MEMSSKLVWEPNAEVLTLRVVDEVSAIGVFGRKVLPTKEWTLPR
jgi:hypothetical protein